MCRKYGSAALLSPIWRAPFSICIIDNRSLRFFTFDTTTTSAFSFTSQ